MGRQTRHHTNKHKKTPDQHKGKRDGGDGGKLAREEKGTKEEEKKEARGGRENGEKREERERVREERRLGNGADGATPADPPRTRAPEPQHDLGEALGLLWLLLLMLTSDRDESPFVSLWNVN